MAHSVDEQDLAFALNVADATARSAGALLRQAFRRPRIVEEKGVNDLVTDADKASEVLIAGLLRNAFPTWGLAGEEGVRVNMDGNSSAGTPPLTWWIDPLDGTSNFVHGIPRFSVSIAAVDPDGKVMVGVVYDPNFNDCCRAIRGQGATRNGEPLHVSSKPQLRTAIAASGFPGDLRTSNNNTAEWAAFVQRCAGMTRMGSAALDLCFVAAGHFDVYWEYGLSAWDMAAGIVICEEAGGTVTDYEGKPFNVLVKGGLLATNSHLHSEAVSVLQNVRNPA